MTVNSGAGNINAPIDFRISANSPVVPVAYNAGAWQKIIDIIYNAIQQVISQGFVEHCGIGPLPEDQQTLSVASMDTILAGNLTRLYRTAGEGIAFGDLINLYSDGGVLKIRKANATGNTKPADGICSAPNGIVSGAIGEVMLSSGLVVSSGAFVLGSRYYLSKAVSGGVTVTAPVAAGNIEQYIGIALDVNTLYCNFSYWIQH